MGPSRRCACTPAGQRSRIRKSHQMLEDFVQFDDFVLNRSACELRRGDALVPLQRVPLELLSFLLERRGQLVTRKEILERVWGKGVFVDARDQYQHRGAKAPPGTVRRSSRAAIRRDGAVERLSIRCGNPPSEAGRCETPTAIFGDGRTRRRVGHTKSWTGRCSGAERPAVSDLRRTRRRQDAASETKSRSRLKPGEWRCWSGHCSEHDEAVAYLPFVEILENFVERSERPGSLRAALGADGPELARLLPKLKKVVPELPLPVALPPPQARRHLFNSFFDFVTRVASTRPAADYPRGSSLGRRFDLVPARPHRATTRGPAADAYLHLSRRRDEHHAESWQGRWRLSSAADSRPK